MERQPRHPRPGRAARTVRSRIEHGGERIWRLDDFRDLPPHAVAQTLSRLARAGAIERLSKGIYYKGRATAFGRSRPNPASLAKLADRDHSVFPAGVAAANLLGFTTQTGGRSELATSASSVPRKLVGTEAIVHTRRPEAWKRLSTVDAALLDFLRERGRASELSPGDTIERTLELLGDEGRYVRLTRIAATEPPRVRAMLGAFGEWLGAQDALLARLRASLNPHSKFDFGLFAALTNARSWQARSPQS